jgi:hypothetical protein
MKKISNLPFINRYPESKVLTLLALFSWLVISCSPTQKANLGIRQNTSDSEKSELTFNHPKTGIAIFCDSLDRYDNFTICYKNNEIAVYNRRKKLKLLNLKAIKVDMYFPKAQIIQNNKLREINVRGTDYKKGDGPAEIDLSYQFPDQYVTLKITKADTVFYLNTHDMINISEQVFFENSSSPNYKLYHTQEVEDIEYMSDDFIKIVMPSMGYFSNPPFIVYTKLKSGKYNLTALDYILSEKPSAKMDSINKNLPKNLDTIKKIYPDMYRIEKNGLSAYYPIVKEIKYKTLEEFQGNFARFELPNGQKGWLDLQGNEYFDN